MPMKMLTILAATMLASPALLAGDDWVTYEGKDGPGKGKHIVLLAGDEEYRSEEALPMLAAILAEKHGFKCTVLFSVNDAGEIDPDNGGSLSNPDALDSADAIIMGLRFRHWADPAMEKFEAAWKRGIPMIGLRTSTHAFNFPKDSKWTRYSNGAPESAGWPGGFGREFLGEKWISHHGHHKVQGTRGVIEAANAKSELLRSVSDVFGDTDVYGANPPADATVLLRGAVTESLDPASKPIDGEKNNPMMPVAWTRTFKNEAGTTNRIFTTTMGSATDLRSEDLRRLVINAVYWGLEMEVPAKAEAGLVAPFEPSPYGFKGYKKGINPSSLARP
ncbi:MAG: ThuA domain-containing protein [Verrucomicrobia bacterium]|nr:ThuA domain-containing protein [Verrucomicrobiota bacterium]MDA1006413.1 ThuA domain-containing protein [Verrucomicrobiota bacterium]